MGSAKAPPLFGAGGERERMNKQINVRYKCATCGKKLNMTNYYLKAGATYCFAHYELFEGDE